MLTVHIDSYWWLCKTFVLYIHISFKMLQFPLHCSAKCWTVL